MLLLASVFTLALVAAWLLTPRVRNLAVHLHWLDAPAARKIHIRAVPRIGGLALFCSFFLPFVLLSFLQDHSPSAKDLLTEPLVRVFALGAVLIFALGLADDLWGISFIFKFIGQFLVSLYSYLGGLQIQTLTSPFGGAMELGLLSFPITLFWFLLVINAINLIDGLDGLAAGICLFASLAMLFVCAANQQIFPALAFAALAGCLLGFLRYNFNPASIFMGDSGSYFLGYALAALSVGTALKGQLATALLIPVIALGIPLMDTLWAPIRRFLAGKALFQPDKGHIHHLLLQRGNSHRRTVLWLYALTMLLGSAAVVLVYSQNKTSALILFSLGLGGIVMIHLLRLTDSLRMAWMASWAGNIRKEMDLSPAHRRLLNQQEAIGQAQSLEALWEAVGKSLDALECQQAILRLEGGEQEYTWSRPLQDQAAEERLLHVDLPLQDEEHSWGRLWISKDIRLEGEKNNSLKQLGKIHRKILTALKQMPAD
jgi:UDP-GlcNAc:undecaprenyl-phosphate GlcNAc-1-phosphate transferase